MLLRAGSSPGSCSTYDYGPLESGDSMTCTYLLTWILPNAY
jgi:hypothetical protein